jgi:hypothetical protein
LYQDLEEANKQVSIIFTIPWEVIGGKCIKCK